jgi:hypothetical protein
MLIVDNSGSFPQSVSIISINYTLTEMTIIWSKSTDSDFDHYELLVSESEEGEKFFIGEVTEINDTTYVLTEFDPTQPRWYWVNVVDWVGYSNISNGYFVLDDNPTPVELYPITYQDGSFTITWSQSIDDDFSFYKLYESLSEDMSGETLIYETDEITDTTYVVTDIGEQEIRYYQVVIEDIWGLQSVSNIQHGGEKNIYVTFQCDMNAEAISAYGVHLTGSFAPYYAEWDPGAIDCYDDGTNGDITPEDGIYSVQLLLGSGVDYGYKFVNGNSWGCEELPGLGTERHTGEMYEDTILDVDVFGIP